LILSQVEENRRIFKEKDSKAFKNSNSNNPSRTIPMVFHVIHQGGLEKIDLPQIEAAIQDANDDYNSANLDKLVPGDPFFEDQASVGIDFELATKDPYGNATNGVTYTESYYTEGGGNFETQIKNLIQWPREHYLNVWVVKGISNSSGYAHYPEVADDYSLIDGIVIGYNYLGKTGQADPSIVTHTQRHILSHEIGHWLGLQHTWGDAGENGNSDPLIYGELSNCNNDDEVSDTPNSIGYSTNLSPNEVSSCDDLAQFNNCTDNYNGFFSAYNYCLENKPPESSDFIPTEWVDNDYMPANIFNMMEYGVEVMFTNGQKTRMLSYLNDTISDRNIIGTQPNTVYIPSGNSTLTVDGYYFKESAINQGEIYNEITLELSQGTFNFSGGYINLSNVTVSNIPPGLNFQIKSVPGEPNKAKMILLGTAESHSIENDISNIEVTLKSGAFSGVSFGNLYNYNLASSSITLSGFKIDFDDLEPLNTIFSEELTTNFVCEPVDNGLNGEYGAFYLQHAGYLAVLSESSTFYLLKESGIEVEVATTGIQSYDNNTGLNTYEVEYYNEGTEISQIPGHLFQPITRDSDDENALVLPGVNTERFIAFKISTNDTEGARTLYGWIRVEMDLTTYCVNEALYHTAGDMLSLKTGEYFDNCESYPITSEILPDLMHINNQPITNGMTLHAQNYSVDFSVSSIFYYVNWGIWIDIDKNGRFDYDESFYFFNEEYFANNPNIGHPSLNLTNVADGQYAVRIILSGYNFNNYDYPNYCIMPCMPYEYGSTHDFIINIGNPVPEECCPDSKHFYDENLPLETHTNYYISTLICEVSEQENVSLKSGQTIVLFPPFISKEGSNFLASIQDCDPNNCNGNRLDDDKFQENKFSPSFNIYPNPVEHIFTLEYNLEYENKVSFEIYDISGNLKQVIHTPKLQKKGHYSLDVNVNSFATGIYLIQGTIGSERIFQKMVKAK